MTPFRVDLLNFNGLDPVDPTKFSLPECASLRTDSRTCYCGRGSQVAGHSCSAVAGLAKGNWIILEYHIIIRRPYRRVREVVSLLMPTSKTIDIEIEIAATSTSTSKRSRYCRHRYRNGACRNRKGSPFPTLPPGTPAGRMPVVKLLGMFFSRFLVGSFWTLFRTFGTQSRHETQIFL